MSNHEIKCPNCDTVFNIDEMQYADILSQVKNDQFEKELHEKLMDAERLKDAEIQLAKKEAIEKLKDELSKKDQSIAEFKAKIEAAETEKKFAVQQALTTVEKERDQAKAELAQAALQQEIEVGNVKQSKELEISELKARLEEARKYNISLSTKGIGEAFENYCRTEFEKIRATAFPRAHFEKDSTVVENTKGDFVFRDFDEKGVEIISIMFEMKNEGEDTKKGQKNESFYEKLDKDRTKKNCEYAVLVTTLEKENDLFNSGIVDVSHRFEKMYVIRPQFFIPMITTLRNAAMKSLKVKGELESVRAQNIDITNFESSLNAFKLDAERIYGWAKDRYDEAIGAIDNAIDQLEDAKKLLETSRKHLGTANGKAEKLTIRSLTKNNPTMEQMFRELDSHEGAE